MNPLDIRKIIHVDMDAFFASVEQRNNPSLLHKPVIVGGAPNSRSVVATCSYEARRYGIHSAMPCSKAYQLCPQAIFVSPNFPEYQRVSKQVQAIFHEVSDLVEPLSLDEAYLDVTQNKHHEKSATRIAQWLRSTINERTGLSASAGVSYNKFLAKIASDWKKPKGLTVITPERAQEFLDTVPIEKLWGVGPVTAERMKKIGITTCADLRGWSLHRLVEIFGKSGIWYEKIGRGIDDRIVETTRLRKSLSRESTFNRDIYDENLLNSSLEKLVKTLWETLRKEKIQGKTVTIKVKYADFHQITRSRSAKIYIPSEEKLCLLVRELFQETKPQSRSRPIRLLGIAISSLSSQDVIKKENQLSLPFGKNEKEGNPSIP